MNSSDRITRENYALNLRKVDHLALWGTGLSGVSALVGAVEMLVWSQGNAYLPRTLLALTPFRSFTLPGALLGAVVGGSSALAVFASVRKTSWRSEALVLAGGTLTAWIACEFALLRIASWLHAVYGGLGVGLIALGLVRTHLAPTLRSRWLVGTTLAESLGYMAPALAGIWSARTSSGPNGVLLAMAGLIEGFCLGFGQATVLPWKVNRRQFAVATAVAAGWVWASVYGMMRLGASPLTWALKGPLLAVCAIVALLAIGFAQWSVLRRWVDGADDWILWTAVAWIFGLPMSFLPAPLVDETTPLATHVVLWCFSGVLMAHVMAWGTWIGVAKLSARANAGLATPSAHEF